MGLPESLGSTVPAHFYILHSETCGRHYCGFSDDVSRRVRQHNDPGYVLSKTTKRWPGPWDLVWTEAHPDRASAMQRELQIKKRGIGRFLQAQSVESRPRRD